MAHCAGGGRCSVKPVRCLMQEISQDEGRRDEGIHFLSLKNRLLFPVPLVTMF